MRYESMIIVASLRRSTLIRYKPSHIRQNRIPFMMDLKSTFSHLKCCKSRCIVLYFYMYNTLLKVQCSPGINGDW